MNDKKNDQFAFSKKNYTLLLIGLIFIILGILLMIGGGSETTTTGKEIFGFQRLTLAPIIIAIGFVIEIFAILSSPNNKK